MSTFEQLAKQFRRNFVDDQDVSNNKYMHQFDAMLHRILFFEAHDGMMLVSNKNGILAVNHAQYEMLGYEASEMYGMFPWQWDAHFSKEEIIAMMHRGEMENLRFETLHKRKDGSVFPVEVTANSMTVDGESLFFCIARDLTELKHQQEYVDHLASTDELTDLPNRRELNRVMNQQIAKSNDDNSLFSVVMIDIDFFKTINDKFGHSIGDVVLKEFGQSVKTMIRKADFISRWGGEEFFIILPDTDRVLAKQIAEKLRTQIQQAEFGGMAITISVGVAEYTSGESLETILKRVDAAVYQAKANGRNRVELAEHFSH
jgi:diguanylate cyclase (GGDEF)-like protein/PAS domain S-box-containing protein